MYSYPKKASSQSKTMIFRCLYGQSTTIPIFRSPKPTALRLLQSPRQSAALQGICHQQLLLRSNMVIPGKSLNSMEVSSLDNPLWWPLPRLTAGGYTAIKWFAYLHKIVGFSLYGWFLGSIPWKSHIALRSRTVLLVQSPSFFDFKRKNIWIHDKHIQPPRGF